MRTIAISDIHGCHDRMKALLEKVKYNKYKDRLYVLGDLIDRGYKSKEVVQFLMNMSKSYEVKVIGGNHEDMFLDWLEESEDSFPEYVEEQIGGIYTIGSFLGDKKYNSNKDIRSFLKEEYEEELKFLRGLPNYIEEESYVFVHAGINPFLSNWRNSTRKEFRCIRGRFFLFPHEHPQIFVFGHTVTNQLHGEPTNFDIWEGHNQIGIDGGCCFGGQLNALIITEEGYHWDFVAGGRT